MNFKNFYLRNMLFYIMIFKTHKSSIKEIRRRKQKIDAYYTVVKTFLY